MKNNSDIKFDIEHLKRYTNTKDLLDCGIGVEREGLRVTAEGSLALTPHPKAFGNKLKNPLITTDFSESQIEIVTPIMSGPRAAYQELSGLCDIVNYTVPDNEFFWPQSIPGIVPNENIIPIAQYEGGAEAQKAMDYRHALVKKYGAKKQLISGIHFNFSFSKDMIQKLYSHLGDGVSLKDFSDTLYLKVIRNYLRTRWLIIYLTGCSMAAHNSFLKDQDIRMELSDGHNGHYTLNGVSLRNSSMGYKNPVPLFPRYDSVEHFVQDVQGFVDNGKLSEPKELYTQIRLKPKNVHHLLDSLSGDGIQYVEIRTMDLNPFDACGISETDLSFMRVYMIYLLIKAEDPYKNWQEEGLVNEDKTASNAFDTQKTLTKNGEEIRLREWGLEILNEIDQMDDDLKLGQHAMIMEMKERVLHFQKTYARQMAGLIHQSGYIEVQMSLARQYKMQSIERMNKKWNPEIKKMVAVALSECDR